jgi:hypothetical protein
MISSKRRSSSPTPTIGQLTQSLVPETCKIQRPSDLTIEFYARNQTRLIAELNNAAHRHQTPTWNTLLWDNQRYQALNSLSSVLFLGVATKNLRLALDSVKSTASTGTAEGPPSTPGATEVQQGTSDTREQANITTGQIIIVPKRGDSDKHISGQIIIVPKNGDSDKYISNQRIVITKTGEIERNPPLVTRVEKAKSRKIDTPKKRRNLRN